jgi:hypothetical protein
LRFRPATAQFEQTQTGPDFTRWNHPLASVLVSEPDHRPRAGDHAPPERTIELSGVASEPKLLDLLTGIVWVHAPANEDDYDACRAAVASHHELGFLDGQRFTALPPHEYGDVYLVGAIVLGSRVEAVVGTRGTRAAVMLLLNGQVPATDWTLLDTGIHHNEDAVFADPRLGPYCGP